MKIIFFFFWVFLVNNICAQNPQTITVNPSESLSQQDFNRLIYKYPTFTFGKMYFQNGDSAGGYINYNLFLDRFQFIDDKGDTLVVANQDEIKKVAVGTDRFVYQNKEFLQITINREFCKVAERPYVKVADKRKKGAFGLATIANIESDDAFRADNKSHKLMINEDVILLKGVLYYLSNNNGDFLTASKKTILKLFPKKQNEINKYLDQKNVSFHSQSDIVDLLNFLESVK